MKNKVKLYMRYYNNRYNAIKSRFTKNTGR